LPKYLVKTTLVYHYELEAKDEKSAYIEATVAGNLEKYYWIRDVVNAEVTELDDTYEGLHTIEEPEWQGK
jgi:hypothetical protein